jgi:hypothetical protein
MANNPESVLNSFLQNAIDKFFESVKQFKQLEHLKIFVQNVNLTDLSVLPVLPSLLRLEMSYEYLESMRAIKISQNLLHLNL